MSAVTASVALLILFVLFADITLTATDAVAKDGTQPARTIQQVQPEI
jgi:hypothetical protein